MTLKRRTILIVALTMVFMGLYLANGLNHEVEAFNPLKQYASIEKSVEGLNEYKADNDELINNIKSQNIDDVRCTITFKHAISLEKLEEICLNNDIDIKVVETRHLLNDERYTSATIFSGNFEELRDEINAISQNIGGGYKGVIDIFACVDSNTLKQLNTLSEIYLIDVSGDAASVGFYEKDGEKRNLERFDNGLNDYPHALSWDLEELRM